MADTSIFHVNGPARIFTGTGVSGALEHLGLSIDGVDLVFEGHFEDVIDDEFGPIVPAEVQSMLQSAHIMFRLVKFDNTVLDIVRALPPNSTPGIMPIAGSFLNQTGDNFRVLIDSVVDGTPYNFPACYLDGTHRIRRGTRRDHYELDFRALPWDGTELTAGTTFGKILWNRDNSGKPAGF